MAKLHKHGVADPVWIMNNEDNQVFIVTAPGEQLMVSDPLVDIPLGNVTGQTIMRALGERESIGLTAAGEDLWRGNELSPAPTSHLVIPTPAAAGEQMSVVSESGNDDGAPLGSGVQQVRIEYLDANGDEQTEDVVMNGTTPVDLLAADVRFVNNMYSIAVGAGGVADDYIKIHNTADAGLVYNMIALGGNKSLVPHRMVPRAKTLILRGWNASEGNAKRGAFRIRSTDMNGVLLPGVFCFKGSVYLNQTASGELVLSQEIPALSIIKVSVWATAINGEGSAFWWGVLVDD